jgi:hypothetical protein
MVKWKLGGREAEARADFDAAVEWWQERAPEEPLLGWLHEEAKQVLGLRNE